MSSNWTFFKRFIFSVTVVAALMTVYVLLIEEVKLLTREKAEKEEILKERENQLES